MTKNILKYPVPYPVSLKGFSGSLKIITWTFHHGIQGFYLVCKKNQLFFVEHSR
jgi:hypothetical protein